jgi:hypothetical protein
MLMPNLLKNFTVRNIGGTSRLTSKAAHTFGGVMSRERIRRESSLGFFTPQSQPTTRRIILVAGHLVRRAHCQTKTAMHAVRQHFAECGMSFIVRR